MSAIAIGQSSGAAHGVLKQLAIVRFRDWLLVSILLPHVLLLFAALAQESSQYRVRPGVKLTDIVHLFLSCFAYSSLIRNVSLEIAQYCEQMKGLFGLRCVCGFLMLDGVASGIQARLFLTCFLTQTLHANPVI